MLRLLRRADDILRRRPWTTSASSARHVLPRLAICLLVFGMIYGAAMGSFGGISGDHAWQIAFSAVKVPLLLLATFAIGLPSFFVINTLVGLRRDFVESLRALVAAQAGMAIVLASLAPFTLFWYASCNDYEGAILFNGLMFAVASFSGQKLLRDYYRPLVLRNAGHRPMLWTWLTLYVFIGIQMGMVLRPFVGTPGAPAQFFRSGAWENAYDVVAGLIYNALRGASEHR
jgi:hypothetical protein